MKTFNSIKMMCLLGVWLVAGLVAPLAVQAEDAKPPASRSTAKEASPDAAVPVQSKPGDVKANDSSTKPAAADKTDGAKTAAPKLPADVLVSVYIINIGKFDVATGGFTVDFYLDLQHDAGVDPTNFEFVNGRASSSDLMISTPTEHFYRIQADLVSPIDLRKYPFDHQKLRIILEDKRNTIEKLRYVSVEQQSQLDKSVNFVGWDIDQWSAYTRVHDYEKWKEKYSQYVFEIEISRIVLNAFMKTFLPVFFIVLIVLSSFTMGVDQMPTRLGMAGSGLVAAVMFHVSISSQIPPVGYLTFADKFMALTYLVTLVSFMIDVAILASQRIGNAKSVERLHRTAEIAMFILVPLAYILLFVFVS